ncbi:hypothetical protein [Dickeya dianthicola]|uniref:hypothetical protein n=1 Tax=Dickeya dianthicola TaxID=204039 RepID=UPI0008FBFEDB|nr:hypothetical protein [Dickeya dianthicola]MCI4205226.1 hypothetical protein [Dickeya dianthicola]MCI4214051.1 hypothetical protein [Dickeya dianthicola]MCI4226659.1 hypothetical protein [Dickeya dianthicola]MZG44852.1 hypothetical protein [Dickeya dianthicola]MZI00509.1 hypothetical protein [Dickeya dianthicola]
MFKVSIIKGRVISIAAQLIALSFIVGILLVFSRAPMNDEASYYIGSGTDIISLREVNIKRFNGWYYSLGCLLEVNGHLVTASPDSCNQLLNETITLFDKYYPTKPREFIINGQSVGRCSDLTTPRCPVLEDNK